MSEVITAIPVFNGERYLCATLESLAAQGRRPDRVVVIDDCSTDGTRELVRGCDSIRCELVRNETNLGLFLNLNRALEYAAEAEYFHLLLADDCVRPNFIECLVDSLAAAAAPSLAYCAYDWIDADGQVTRRAGGNGRFVASEISRRDFLSRQSALKTVSVGSVVIRSGHQTLPVKFRSDMPHVADCVFYAELAASAHQILAFREALCEIRRHSENATSRNAKNLNAWVADEWRAMRCISNLIRESNWRRCIRGHYQQCLFAARSRVKQQWTRADDPHFACQIGVIVEHETSWHHRFLAAGAVLLRDLVKGKNLPTDPR
ncbi:MAG: putative teichuronic acid biosynthesis glycosyltransferase TuaG [Verrucomicrobia subdivision 3 bacterium]|nr:putative teichuronic acid biosynthesis glycosyltransferase TuaG [Limisphaerales bacterium]MCS1413356.1 putative teichuronic acid biosynthesis glycosyltransferase TuaG [Limisphaerales bacterium]